jgi:hypothetical protein
MWLREVRTVALEEREDEPPEAERDRPVDVHLNQLLKAMKGKKEGKKS